MVRPVSQNPSLRNLFRAANNTICKGARAFRQLPTSEKVRLVTIAVAATAVTLAALYVLSHFLIPLVGLGIAHLVGAHSAQAHAMINQAVVAVFSLAAGYLAYRISKHILLKQEAEKRAEKQMDINMETLREHSVA